jgi:hypothetical protein
MMGGGRHKKVETDLRLSLERGSKMDRPGKRRKEDDLTLKCIAPIRVRDFGRVESQLSFFLFLSTCFFLF